MSCFTLITDVLTATLVASFLRLLLFCWVYCTSFHRHSLLKRNPTQDPEHLIYSSTIIVEAGLGKNALC